MRTDNARLLMSGTLRTCRYNVRCVRPKMAHNAGKQTLTPKRYHVVLGSLSVGSGPVS